MKKIRTNKKGFTLAELLIVVAIIGVLVAISIPIFTAQLEKARDATDEANIRSAYAEVSAAILTDDKKNSEDGIVTYTNGTYSATVSTTGKTAGWSGAASATDTINIGGQDVKPSQNGWTISGSVASEKVTIEPTK